MITLLILSILGLQNYNEDLYDKYLNKLDVIIQDLKELKNQLFKKENGLDIKYLNHLLY